MAEPTFGLEIKVDGRKLAEEALDVLSSLRVERSLGTVAHMRLAFVVDDDGGPVAGLKIGAKISLAVVPDESQTTWGDPIFQGLIVGVGAALDAGTSQVFTVDAYDESYKLRNETLIASAENATRDDVVKTIASASKLKIDIAQGALGHAKSTFQRFATGRQYLDAVCHEAGCEWFVAKGTLHVRPRRSGAGTTIELEAGRDLVQFDARYSVSDHVTDVEVNGWNPVTKKRIVGRSRSWGDDSGFSLGSAFPKHLGESSGVGGTKVVSIPRPVTDQKDAEELATGIVRQREAALLRGRGEVSPPRGDIVPGAKLNISGMVLEDWNGTYYCTAVEHVWNPGDSFRTRFEVGSTEPTGLVDLFGSSGHPTLERMLGSLTIGVVTNNNDPDAMHRVRVTFPYLSDTIESAWARVLQAGAGAGRGFHSMPEVDDEVLVGFEHGDIDHPFVLGGLFNGKDKSNYGPGEFLDDGKVKNRALRTRVGHELLLSDGSDDGTQFVSITTGKKKSELILAEDRITLIGKEIPITVKNGAAMIEIDKNENVTIKGKTITLDAQDAITIKGGSIASEATKGAIESKASRGDFAAKGMNVKIEGTLNTAIKGSAGVAIN